MPRIRSLKPEFCTSDQVVACSPIARLLFVCMWMFCDDAGVHPASTRRLKMEVFPGDDVSDADIQRLVEELVAAGLLVQFDAENKTWWWVSGWHHQRIDRPNFRYPKPPIRGALDESSSNNRRAVDVQTPPEGIGEEGIGEEYCGEPAEASDSPPPTSPPPAKREKPKAPKPDDGVLEFPVVGKTEFRSWWLTTAKLDEYRESFPGVDVDQEIRAAKQWCIDNRARRKTPDGMHAFLTRWLTKEQNKSTGNGRSGGADDSDNTARDKILRQVTDDAVRMATRGAS